MNGEVDVPNGTKMEDETSENQRASRFEPGKSGVLFEGAFPLGKRLSENDNLSLMKRFLEAIGYEEVHELGDQLENLKFVCTSEEMSCFKFYLDSDAVANNFLTDYDVQLYGRFGYDVLNENLEVLHHTEPLNILWNFSVSISLIGSAIGDLKWPLLHEGASVERCKYLFSAPAPLYKGRGELIESVNVFAAQLGEAVVSELCCDISDLVFLFGRPNVASVRNEKGEPKQPYVNRHHIQDGLAAMELVVVSVYVTKDFNCDMRHIRQRVFQSDLVKDWKIASSKNQVVLSCLKMALERAKKEDWRVLRMNGMREVVTPREIKKTIRNYHDTFANLILSKPTIKPFYGITAEITAPRERLVTIWRDEVLEEELNKHAFLKLRYKMANPEKTPHIFKQMELAVDDLKKIIKSRSGREVMQSTIVEALEEKTGLPHGLWTHEDLEKQFPKLQDAYKKVDSNEEEKKESNNDDDETASNQQMLNGGQKAEKKKKKKKEKGKKKSNSSPSSKKVKGNGVLIIPPPPPPRQPIIPPPPPREDYLEMKMNKMEEKFDNKISSLQRESRDTLREMKSMFESMQSMMNMMMGLVAPNLQQPTHNGTFPPQQSYQPYHPQSQSSQGSGFNPGT